MTKRLGAKIVDQWSSKKGQRVGVAFNMDVSNNKRRVKIRIYLNPNE